MDHVVPLFVAIPLATGFLMPLVGRFTKERRVTALLPLAAVAATLVLAVGLLVGTEDRLVYWVGGWKFPVGISMVADGLSELVLVVVATVSLMAVLFSIEYMRRYTSPGLFYALFMLMVAGMNGVVLAGDLFNIFVFIEVAGLASYALVAFGTESDELEASFKYLVLGTVASAFLLVGIALVYNVTGQLNWDKVAEVLAAGGGVSLPLYVAGAFFLMGFGLKAAMVPFHAWLPDAHPSAPAPISAMLSGVLIKACGVYVLARLVFSVLGSHDVFGTVLVVLGTLSMVVGALMAIGQGDLKRMLAYSSISQVGYVVLALGTGAVVFAASGGSGPEVAVAGLAVFAGLFHLVNHAVTKSLLFLCSGSIEQATGTRRLDEMGGLGRRMPATAWSLRAGALAISGIPPFGGFFSKLLIILALVQAAAVVHGGFYLVAALAVGTAGLTLTYYARAQRAALGGHPSHAVSGAREVPWAMGLASALLAVLCLATSALLLPGVKERTLDPAVAVLTRSAGEPETVTVEGPAARAAEAHARAGEGAEMRIPEGSDR